MQSQRMNNRQQFALVIFFLCATLADTGSALAEPLSSQQFSQFARRCAASVTLPVLRAVANVESRFDPVALRNNGRHISLHLPTAGAAISQAQQWIAAGESVDLGLMQLNSHNLKHLGMTVKTALTPCGSLAGAAQLLQESSEQASTSVERQAALLITFSRYNTGRPLAGVANGYAEQILKILSSPDARAEPHTVMAQQPTPDWDVWANAASAEDRATAWLVTAQTQNITSSGAGAPNTDPQALNDGSTAARKPGEPHAIPDPQASTRLQIF